MNKNLRTTETVTDESLRCSTAFQTKSCSSLGAESAPQHAQKSAWAKRGWRAAPQIPSVPVGWGMTPRS